MSQLSPNENYPIFHGIINHLDTNTYYVRTVIYDSDYNLLATVDLEDQGSQNFLKLWKVPYDNVFQRGKFILLVTSVYTDSGYTTKSANYGDEFETHLVQERWDMAKIASIGGGDAVNYKKLREIVKEEIAKQEHPVQKEIDVKGLVETITDNVSALIPEQKDFPEIPEVDLMPLQLALGNVIKGIEGVSKDLNNRPQFEKTDLSQVTESLKILKELAQRPEFKDVDLTKVFDDLNDLKQILLKDMKVFKVVEERNEEKQDLKKSLIKTLRSKHNV